MTAIYKLLATHFTEQENDDQLYPGKASAEILRHYPPTVIWTGEFHFLRRDNEEFAKILKDAGKQVEIGIMPGTVHGYQLLNFNSSETQEFMK